ncbi:beta-ketoacyl synthase chain length factor [Pararobbsia silviterrae]|uniref:3-oxoacyl-ACP synthase n=1 Tax=Pararobbsia silviterrae TaxID=1792498 RepID=A0A494X7B4_9BURK|nr:beta-ketoacyl synthase chain length factor [Pararobbsia silviterrae]RKP46597.1 3-oxoacyl-ACP synthase [Pararobbsia silviterrae]
MTTTLSAYVEAVGVRGPGLADWPACAAVLRGDVPYAAAPTELPTPERLPSAERRRAVPVVRIAFAAAEQATRARPDMTELPTVFSSSGGDGPNYHAICETLASDDRSISPTRFHNSVHNAPSGYWSIATRDMSTSNVLCAHDASFGAGLLEALAQIVCDGVPVMLVAYESDYPEPLRSVRPIPFAFSVALILSPTPSNQALARLDVSLIDAPHDRLADAGLESLRGTVPSARCLPLLAALAATNGAAPDDASHTCLIEYQSGAALRMRVSPC